jgi:soluble lytic murein transglycosylase
MLAEVGAVDIMRTFFLRMTADAASVRDLALVADLAADLSRPDLMVRSGRLAAASGLVLEEAAFPVPGIRGLLYPANGVPDPAVLLAVARQESLFESTAISRAGARGVLQLMPNTARGVAQALGVGYSESRLLTDPEYNARLGAHYLASQIERYGGDLALALAAYNAGPSRASAWIGDYGDPRRMDLHSRIDWMESIPFSETRNYVQRVLEGMRVYQDRLENGNARIVAFDGLDVPPLPPPQPRLKPRDAS